MPLRDQLARSEWATVVIQDDGCIIGWSVGMEALSGWTRGEVIGKELAETIIPPALRNAHRQGLERFALTGEMPVTEQVLTVDLLHRDGTLIPVHLAITRALNGGFATPTFVGTFRRRDVDVDGARVPLPWALLWGVGALTICLVAMVVILFRATLSA